jgi:hypothetical protein
MGQLKLNGRSENDKVLGAVSLKRSAVDLKLETVGRERERIS